MTAPNDEDTLTIEALITLRTCLAEVQASVGSRVSVAPQEVTEIEQQRDFAVKEAVYAKAKLAAHTDAHASRASSDENRRIEIGRKLAATLATTINSIIAELQAERCARKVAEGKVEVAQRRPIEINQLWIPCKIESSRMDLPKLVKAVRDEAAQKAEVYAAKQMLVLEKDDLSHQLEATIKANKQHSNIFLSLREAVGASEGKASLVRKNLEDEKNLSKAAEQKFQQLGAEHEAKIAELDSMGPRLLSIEEIADSHANEARTHRQVVLTGLDKIITSNWGENSFQITDGRVSILKQQVGDARASHWPSSEIEQLQSENGVLQSCAIEAPRHSQHTSIGNYRRKSLWRHGRRISLPFRNRRSFDNALTGPHPFPPSSSSDTNSLGATHTRNSTALESLATKLETLCTHWEGNNREYKLERGACSPFTPDKSHTRDEISSSLANWRKRLNEEEIQAVDANAAAPTGVRTGERDLKEEEVRYVPGAKREKDRSEKAQKSGE